MASSQSRKKWRIDQPEVRSLLPSAAATGERTEGYPRENQPDYKVIRYERNTHNPEFTLKFRPQAAGVAALCSPLAKYLCS
ncbi:hypothetical protein N8797_01335 [Pontimonas sp.]|nr:hypothetical protein [Pontimonas sp.]